jgi:uncharacterized Zn finger protein
VAFKEEESLESRWANFPWRFGRTKKVEGGIKARAARFGENWWAARWLDLLNRGASRNRLARGRTYARKGQITEFAVDAGKISGSVQGSADEPYDVAILLPVVREKAAERILRSMQRSPLFAARLLNQEMPAEIVKLFEDEGENLYPASRDDLETVCSCPDGARICKHVAALFYLFSLQLERDPLLLLQLRGVDRERLMSEVRTDHLFAPFHRHLKKEPLPSDPGAFWKGTRIPPSSLRTDLPAQNATLAKQLGNFPFWRGENDLAKILEKIYAAAAARAQELLNQRSEE